MLSFFYWCAQHGRTHKKAPLRWEAFLTQNEDQVLQFADIFCSGTFLASHNIETYPVTL